MTPERLQPEYFANFESPHMPECSWQEMVGQGEIIHPRVVCAILDDARRFLITEPGPNLARRQLIVPPWIEYWMMRCRQAIPLARRREVREGFVWSNRIMEFDQVGEFIDLWHSGKAGFLCVAGAEGHPGHVQAARFMKDFRTKEGYPLYSIWGFEQGGYLARKARGATFLPLELILSMWALHGHGPDLVTVMPENIDGLIDSEHYVGIFKATRARYCFAEELDPNLEEKIRRGDVDPRPVIPHLDTETTTDRVQRLGSQDGEEERSFVDRVIFTNGTVFWLASGYGEIVQQYPWYRDLLQDGAVFEK